MTQEDKQLLLKDLSGRLFCGVKYTIYDDKTGNTAETLLDIRTSIENEIEIDLHSIEDVKLYLRPMSSMTEEELREFAVLKFKNDDIWEIDEFPKMNCFKGFINIQCRNKNNGNTWIYQVRTRTPLETYWGIDWLNEHHFDYRGLIDKGLALEAPDNMYKTE